MQKLKISFSHECGKVDGIYFNAGKGSPLVIIINGHNGFYNYGMFPYLQESLAEKSISSYSFNFSHGGVNGDADFFEDLEKYEQNCMRLETEDLMCVLENLTSGKFEDHPKTFLLAHSLGGVPAIFGAKKASANNINIDGVILVSTVKTLCFWPDEMIQEWAANGVFLKKNNRTKQDLPQGSELLQEVLTSSTTWNVEHAARSLTMPVLILHGENDEAVPVEHGTSLFEWIRETNADVELKIIPGATHTYDTKHPFEGASIQLNELIFFITDWVKHK